MSGYGRFLLRGTAGPLRVRSYCSIGPFSPQSSVLASKPLGEIVRGWIVFKLLGYDWIVRNSLTLYNVSKRLLGVGMTRRLLKMSIGGQFLGGFSEDEARGVAQKIASRNICSIWNFSTEQDLSEEGADLSQEGARFDQVTERYLKSICLSGIILQHSRSG
jgi:hypothetical protein